MITFMKRKQLKKKEVVELEKAVSKYMQQVEKQIKQIEAIERKVFK